MFVLKFSCQTILTQIRPKHEFVLNLQTRIRHEIDLFDMNMTYLTRKAPTKKEDKQVMTKKEGESGGRAEALRFLFVWVMPGGERNASRRPTTTESTDQGRR